MKLPVVGVVLALLMGFSGVADAQITIRPPAPDPNQPKLIARDVNCAYSSLSAKVLGIPLCPNPPQGQIEVPPNLVADTIPGTAGFPSSQVITVQGCTGCISTGGGGGGGGGASYNVAYGQTSVASSVTGIGAYDATNSNFDVLTAAPFGGNNAGTGYPMAYGQPGALVVQGGLQGGAIAIQGTLGGSLPVPVGTAAFTPAQGTLTTTTAALIIAARTGASGTGRASVTIVNNSNTAIYLGNSGVTSSTGLILPGVVGASVTLPTTAAIYGCLASAGSAAYSEYELY